VGRRVYPRTVVSVSLACSRHDIAEKMLSWHKKTITQSLTLILIIIGVSFVICVCLRIVMSNTLWVTWRVSYKRHELLILSEYPGSSQAFCGVRVAHLFSFVCWVVFLCFFCLCSVSCIPNVTSVSGLSILDFPFSFL